MDTLKIKESGVTQLNFSELTTYSGGGWWADFKAGDYSGKSDPLIPGMV